MVGPKTKTLKARFTSLFNNKNNRAINRTKIMSKIEEYKSELVRIQDIAILDTVDLGERIVTGKQIGRAHV